MVAYAGVFTIDGVKVSGRQGFIALVLIKVEQTTSGTATICAERLASGVRRNRDLALLALLAALL
jgi:hypothetical protein